MTTFSMTFTDPYPGFQGHGIFEYRFEYLKNRQRQTNKQSYYWRV